MIRFLLTFIFAASFSIRVEGANPAPAPSAQEIVEKAVRRTQTAHQKKYPLRIVYQKLAVTEQLNSKGRVTDREEKLYSITTLSNKIYLRLLKLDGKAPSEATLKKENQEIAEGNRYEEPKSPRGEE